jgi:microcystin synthetase protein McyG
MQTMSQTVDSFGQTSEREPEENGANTSRPAISRGGPLLHQPELGTTLADVLLRAATVHAQRGILCLNGDGEQQTQTYASLLLRARRWLGGLHNLGVRPGDCLLLQIPDGNDLWTALWACFLGGIVPLSLAVDATFTDKSPTVRKLMEAWERLQRPVILASDSLLPSLRRLGEEQGLQGLRTSGVLALAGDTLAPIHHGSADDLALLLLTSGSTGRSKIVPHSHATLLHMADGTIQMNGFTAADTSLNWMPLDHVGALVFLGIMSARLGSQQLHVATDLLLRQPLRWLELIEQHRASISWAPNFAFALLTGQEAALAQRQFDLSSMRFLVNAGEQVGQKVMRRFLSLLGNHGLPEGALRPAFGMSETCSGITWSSGLTREQLAQERPFLPLGRPIPGAELRITDDHGRLLAEGQVGRLQLKGLSVMAGYYADPERNREAFEDGWFTTGDLGCIEDGQLIITGRQKQEIIVNGINYAAHEIESLVEEVDGVHASYTAAFAVRDPAREVEVLAVVFSPWSAEEAEWPVILRHIRGQLGRTLGVVAEFLIPLPPQRVPKTSIGKIQRELLRKQFLEGQFADLLARLQAVEAEAQPRGGLLSATEQRIAAIFSSVLGRPQLGREENFFELGGHSLLLVKVHQQLEAAFARSIPIADLFRHSSVATLATYLDSDVPDDASAKDGQARADVRRRSSTTSTDIAVIGLACRFPGADTPEAFWQNLLHGVESISDLTDDELAAAGVPAERTSLPSFVKRRPLLRGADCFDADFFGYSAREAELIDPQQRLFLEVCHECLERAAINPQRHGHSIGVFAGASTNSYLLNHWVGNRADLDAEDATSVVTLDSMSGFQMMVASDKDYLTTRASYKLDLRGPSVNVQTACSTGLVAVHMAAQSLRAGECDMALCGGVSVNAPQETGYLYQEGMIVSRDGHCRAFDAEATGTVFGSGVGVVLLKRLADAQRDGDTIYAVVKGSAINNDGGAKLGYLAPGSSGQASVVAEALAMAGIDPATLGLVEAHGTATPMGDPVEFDALAQALRAHTHRQQFCALGSVKTNVGHLQIASGIAGFIKAVLSLHHQTIPATLHFQKPNPRIDFERSPFFINRERLPWAAPISEFDGQPLPRRAGVHSLGIGGANAHVILEQAPAIAPAPTAPDRSQHILTLSAKTPQALAARAVQLADFLASQSPVALADLCLSANSGRAHFAHRMAIVAPTATELYDRLRASDVVARQNVPTAQGSPTAGLAFLFTGQGSQYAGMARLLYQTHADFRRLLDHGEALFQKWSGYSLLEIMFSDDGRLHDTTHAQPALFLIEVALSDLLRSWGVQPTVLFGHSLGTYAAAACAGVFSLESGLRLVTQRARLMGALPTGGAMASIFASESDIRRLLAPFADRLVIAARNGEAHSVVSGEQQALAALCHECAKQGIESKMLRVSHAFHSPLMRPMLSAYEQVLRGIELSPPQLPILADLTGQLAGAELASPAYWLRHLVEPVQFHGGLATLVAQGCTAFVELGPQPALLAMGRETLPASATAVACLRRERDDWAVLLDGLAQLYVRGVSVDWDAFDAPYRHQRKRVPLPSYPFERRRYMLPLRRPGDRARPAASSLVQKIEAGDRTGLLSTLQSLAANTSGAALTSTERQLLPRLVDLLLASQRPSADRPRYADWLYQLNWLSRPLAHSPHDRLAGIGQAVANELTQQVAAMGDQATIDRLATTLAALEAISSGYVIRALRALGQPLRVGDGVSTEALLGSGRVLAKHRRLCECLLRMLAEDGILQPEGTRYRVLTAPGDVAPTRDLAAQFQAAPELQIELSLFQRCGEALPAVLEGQVEPLALLFSDDQPSSARAFYRDSILAQAMAAATRRAVQAATDLLTAEQRGRPLRVLEIGAGTGGTTQAILSALPAGSQFTFSDVSPLFVAQAREQVSAAHLLIDYRVLDIEADPAAQGLMLGSCDLIIAGNVLHATADLGAETLPHVRRLLAPGGLLILQEATTPARWFHLIFGLTPGWWRFADRARRPEQPLLSPQGWEQALQQSDYVAATAVAADAVVDRLSDRPLFRQSVIIAGAAALAPPRAEHVCILGDDGALSSALAGQLAARGLSVTTHALDSNQSTWLEALAAVPRRRTHWVYLAALDLPSVAALVAAGSARIESTCAALLPLLRILESRDGVGDKLWLVTRDAVACREGDRCAGLAGAPLWGLGRVIALEQPSVWGGLLDIDPHEATAVAAQRICVELLQPDGEDQVAHRQGQRWVARLHPRPASASPSSPTGTDSPLALRSDATYLITGGLGNLGLRLAGWLADRGARHLVLTTRRPPPDLADTGRLGANPRSAQQATALAALAERGVAVDVVQADAADEEAMSALLRRLASGGRPLRGLFHLAGVSGPAARLSSVSSAGFIEAFRAKVRAAWLLHHLLTALAPEPSELDFFVLFSSAGAVWGAEGQGGYDAASCFLDALAHHRRAMGLPALSLDFALMDGGGMVSPDYQAWLNRLGLLLIPAHDGFDAMASLLGQTAQAVIAHVDWPRFKSVYESRGRRPLLQDLGARPTAVASTDLGSAAASTGAQTSLLSLLAVAPAATRRQQLSDAIRGQLGRILGVPQTQPFDPNAGFFTLGLDSLGAVELKNRLQQALGTPLTTSVVFDYPTIDKLTDHLATRVMGWSAAAPPPRAAADAVLPPDNTQDPLAAELASLERLLASDAHGGAK